MADTGQNLITIAIDFGTTFSGAAWHWTGNPGVKNIVMDWPESNGRLHPVTDQKLPTKISYGQFGTPVAWGIQVQESEKHFAEFKLALGGKKIQETKLTNEYPDPSGLPLSPQFTSMKLTVDYLRLLKDHTLQQIGDQISEFTVQNTPINWILTIPAIWTEDQKNATRFCAERAGLVGGIRLVSEPEVAMIHAIESMGNGDVSTGDTFVLCDCGGGTVDLITYVVEQLEPFQVKEVVRGDGDRCGGVFIDRAFTKYMKEKFSNCAGWSEDNLREAVQQFEKVTKRLFDGSKAQVVLKVPGLRADPSKGIRKEKVLVPCSDIQAIFEPALHVVKQLVQEQISAAHRQQYPATAVLLVGGFGQSPYLEHELQKTVGPDIKVLQVKDGRTAVLQGALSKGINIDDPENATIDVTSRIARKFFGVSYGIRYESSKHDPAKKYWVPIEQKHFVDVAHWFIKQGIRIPERGEINLTYYEAWFVGETAPVFTLDILAWNGPTEEEEELPAYNDPSLHSSKLEVSLTRIPTDTLTRSYHDRQHKFCYECNIEIRVVYGSTGLEYALYHKGRCYGKVEAKYH